MEDTKVKRLLRLCVRCIRCYEWAMCYEEDYIQCSDDGWAYRLKMEKAFSELESMRDEIKESKYRGVYEIIWHGENEEWSGAVAFDLYEEWKRLR